ncbi:MAG: GNAT family N-acetyltransferase [Anaerolineae bacterium]|nr:GNAT family N-acetyltransferase [Anaerolineae bacterium]
MPYLVPKRFVVGTLVVHEGFGRRGIGRALMAAVEEWGKGQGAEECQLTVHAANRGAMFFCEALESASAKQDPGKPLDR